MAKTADTQEQHRDWNWEDDGTLEGMYVGTRQVTIKNGPSAGKTKTVIDFHVGLDDELVTIWPGTVLARKLREELKARKEQRDASDFEPSERMTITPKGMREGSNGPYRDFEDVVFEHPAEKPSALDLLATGDLEADTSDFVPASAQGDLPSDY